MSKEYPEDILISLARKAKKIEPLPEGSAKTEVNVNNIYEFFDALDITGGRYEVKLTELYNIYSIWDDSGTSYKKFRKKLGDVVVLKGQNCKLNRKLKTIQQTYKELNNDEEEKDEGE